MARKKHPQPKKASPKPQKRQPVAKSAKQGSDEGLLSRYEFHKARATHHNAHADLIEARLRTQGKRISYGDGPMEPGKPAKRRIVKESN